MVLPSTNNFHTVTHSPSFGFPQIMQKMCETCMHVHVRAHPSTIEYTRERTCIPGCTRVFTVGMSLHAYDRVRTGIPVHTHYTRVYPCMLIPTVYTRVYSFLVSIPRSVRVYTHTSSMHVYTHPTSHWDSLWPVCQHSTWPTTMTHWLTHSDGVPSRQSPPSPVSSTPSLLVDSLPVILHFLSTSLTDGDECLMATG